MARTRSASYKPTAAAYEEYKAAPPAEPTRARGASGNPANRFQALRVEMDPVEPPDGDEERPLLPTHFYRDLTKSIIARNDSPDVGFEQA